MKLYRNSKTDATALARVLSSRPLSTLLRTAPAGNAPAPPAEERAELKVRWHCCQTAASGACNMKQMNDAGQGPHHQG